jgi:hypothetical protein
MSSHKATRPVATISIECTIGVPAHVQVLSEGLLHTVFANEEEAAAVLKAAAAHPASGSGGTADSAQNDSGGSGGPSEQSDEAMPNGHSHAVDGCSAAADCSADPAQQGQVHDEAAAAAQRWLLQYCQVAVISLGPRGCMARGRHGGTAACAADRCAMPLCRYAPAPENGHSMGRHFCGQHVWDIPRRAQGQLVADWRHCC